MNVYLISEDGEKFCIKANTMFEAVNVSESFYLTERQEEEGIDYNVEHEKKYYHEQILQSCYLIGELKNNSRGSRETKLEKKYRDMENAMKIFVERVDKGEIRSRKTYTKFKEILDL